MRLDAFLPFGDAGAEMLEKKVSTEQSREQIAEARAQRRAETDEKQSQWKWIKESSENAQKDRTRNGERL